MNNHALRIILADLRSAANVGSILRTADATGVELVYAAGYTPYPEIAGDTRPPYIRHANTKAIHKTALGAETSMALHYYPDTLSAIRAARANGYAITILEQAKGSLNLGDFHPHEPVALVLGSEVTGVPEPVLAAADTIIEIPMLGHKESFGVAVAAGIALYWLRFG